MKLWKKVVAMTLCLGFSFSAVGCDLFSSEESSNSGSESSPNQSAPNDSSDIVIPEDADAIEADAAMELQSFLYQSTGTSLPIISEQYASVLHFS